MLQTVLRPARAAVAPVAAIASSIALLAQAHAATPSYPDRPIRMIVPVAAGGGTDLIARLVAAKLAETLGQQVVVDNRPGAGGIIGTETVARAAPDGHTLLLAFASHTTTPLLSKGVPYDPIRSFTPITQIATSPLAFITPMSLPVASMAEMIVYAKSRSGKLNIGAASSGSAVHVVAEQFRQVVGTGLTTVLYKGAGPAMIALLSGEVQMMFSTVPAALPFHKQGKIRLLAVTSRQRLGYLPDVPTMEESGLKGFDVAPWQGLLGPVGLPRSIVDRLHGEVVQMLRNPEFRDRLAAAGSDPIGSTPAEFAAHLQRELEQLGKVIRAAGMKAE